MTKINYNFSEQPAHVAELFCTLGVLQVLTAIEVGRPEASCSFHTLSQSGFQKKSTTFNYLLK